MLCRASQVQALVCSWLFIITIIITFYHYSTRCCTIWVRSLILSISLLHRHWPRRWAEWGKKASHLFENKKQSNCLGIDMNTFDQTNSKKNHIWLDAWSWRWRARHTARWHGQEIHCSVVNYLLLKRNKPNTNLQKNSQLQVIGITNYRSQKFHCCELLQGKVQPYLKQAPYMKQIFVVTVLNCGRP